MTEDDLRRMLIEAYELGREHGAAKEAQERQAGTTWHHMKQRCVETMKELTTL